MRGLDNLRKVLNHPNGFLHSAADIFVQIRPLSCYQVQIIIFYLNSLFNSCYLEQSIYFLYLRLPHENFILIYSYLIREGRREIVWACDRHSNETVTLRKPVTKYKYMRKWSYEIAHVNSTRIKKSINWL